MNPSEPDIVWRKSSFSGGNGNCVEVASTPDAVLVRDSKHPNGPVIAVSAIAWRELARYW